MVTSAMNFESSVDDAGCVGNVIFVAVGPVPVGVLVAGTGVIVGVAVGGGRVWVAVGISADDWVNCACTVLAISVIFWFGSTVGFAAHAVSRIEKSIAIVNIIGIFKSFICLVPPGYKHTRLIVRQLGGIVKDSMKN